MVGKRNGKEGLGPRMELMTISIVDTADDPRHGTRMKDHKKIKAKTDAKNFISFCAKRDSKDEGV